MGLTLLNSEINSKDTKLLVKNSKEIDPKESNLDLFEDVISSLLDKIEDNSSKEFLLAKFLNLPINFEKDQNIVSSFSHQKLDIEQSDHKDGVVIDELLKLSILIKNSISSSELKGFPTDSKELKSLLDDKKFLTEIKSVTNIKQLLNLAEQNGIKVKNFQFFKEDLALDRSDQKVIKDLKSADIFKIIDNKLNDKSSTNAIDIKTNTTKEYTLKELLTSVNEHNSNKILNNTDKIKSDTSNNPTNDDSLDMELKSKAHANDLNKIATKEINKDHIQTNRDRQNLEDSKVKQIKTEHIVQKDTNTKQIQIVNQNSSNKTNNYTPPINDIDRQEETTNSTLSKSDEKLSTKLDQSRVNSLQESQIAFKSLENNTTQQNLSIHSSDSSSDIKVESIQSETKVESSDQSISKSDNKLDSIKSSNIDRTSTELKRTFDSFATDFKERVESYKPPLMKVTMQLNPTGLGEVDVTIVNRGNNLHININSNPNTIALFSQNQADFKTSLVNLGFSELSMNFSDNKNQKDNQQDRRSQNSVEEFEEFESENEDFQIITPRYV
jgi:hypothetical protein